MEYLNHKKITHALGDLSASLHRLEILQTVDSTNDYLVNQRQFPGNYAVLAEQQTAGRGRQLNRWISPPGNIYFSLLWHYSKPIQPLLELYSTSSYAVIQALQEAGFQGIYIKSPNDIFYAGEKLGGILIESFGPNANTYDVVIGIGLNLYPFPKNDGLLISQPWISLHTLNASLAAKRNYLVSLLLKYLITLLLSKE